MPEYNYNSNGVYYIAVCTKDRKQLLSHVDAGTTLGRPPQVHLSAYGRIAEEAILILILK